MSSSIINGGEDDKAQARQRRGEAERRSRQRARVLKLNKEITWATYNPNFATSGTAGELELHGFLQRLERVSTFANTRLYTARQLLTRLRGKSKLEILAQLESELLSIPQDDVILLTNTQSLENALSQPFTVPLLHRAAVNPPSLGPCTNFGIQDLLKHLAEDEEASISVYDYCIEDPLQRTCKTNVRELLSLFSPGSIVRTPLNFLDIENRTRIQFCPFQIILHDITTKLEAQKQHDKGKTGSEWEPELQNEFFLLSLENAISTIHIDTGSAVTWILILSGRKIWYFPRHVTAQTVRWLSQAGSQSPEHYEGGWAKVELGPGDLFLMPPSFPHAVFTPEDCLAVGGQIYTTGNLGRSIEGLKVQEEHPDLSNEDLHDSIYSSLANFLREYGAFMTSVEKAQIVSSCSLFPNAPTFMAEDKHSKASIMDMLRSRGVAFNSRAKRNKLLELLKENDQPVAGMSSTQAVLTPRNEFLAAIQTFCKEFIDRMVDEVNL